MTMFRLHEHLRRYEDEIVKRETSRAVSPHMQDYHQTAINRIVRDIEDDVLAAIARAVALRRKAA